MAATVGTTGFGTLLKVGNGATVEVFTTVAEVKSISGPNLSLEFAEATHMESPNGFREYLPTFKDSGDVTLECNFLPANTQHKQLTTDMVARTLRNFKLNWPNTGGTVWSFAAYISGFSPSASVGDMLAASVTLRPTGAVTIS